MAVIRYKDTDGHWVRLSASDIGAASDSLIARGVGKPIVSDTNTHIQNDTVLYIDQNEYDGDNTTITRFNADGLVIPVPVAQGGTGAKTPEKARENLGISVSTFIDAIYPTGSIYMNTRDTNPAELFPNTTWSKISGRFLVGVNDTTFRAGISGGSSTHTLTPAECAITEHTHSFTASPHAHKISTPTSFSNLISQSDKGFYTTTIKYTAGTAVASGVVKNLGSSETVIIKAGASTVTAVATGSTNNPTPANAQQPFEILPPYLPVYMWERTN